MNRPPDSTQLPHKDRLTRGVEAFRWLLVIASFAVALGAFVVHREVFLGEHGHAPDRYHCPMHPEIRSASPGTCPICSMQLEPIPDGRGASTWDGGTPELPAPAERGVVELTTSRAQQFGVRVETVGTGALSPELRVPVTLVAREGAVAEVRARVPSLVEALRVSRLGAPVQRGAPLLRLFSEDVARLDDELAAARALDPQGTLVAAARTRLDRVGVRREAGSEERGRYTLTAPRAGVITRLDARQGGFVGPEALLVEITDVSRLYAVASVPEHVVASLAGAVGRLELEGAGEAGRDVPFESLEPTLDATTRRARARFVVANEDAALLPGRTGTLVITRSSAAALTVPRDAVLDTGTRRYVYVDRGFGYFEPRTVELGAVDDERVEVLRGLGPSERVVVRGGFLLDSESRLRAAAVSTAPADAGAP